MYRIARTIPTLLGAISFALGIVNTAHATSVDDAIPREKVTYSDLNLDDATGAATLYRRIQEAAYHVCSSYSADPFVQMLRRSCIAHAIGAAVETVNHPRLTALHGARTDRRPLAASNRAVPAL
jgi:UrcA family protein